MPLTKPPPPPPKPVFDEFSTPSDFNDNFKKKETTKYMNPCEMEEKQSMKCLDKNNYDKSKCEYYFLQYRECKKQWVSSVMSTLHPVIRNDIHQTTLLTS
jgi:cytochrome c oxidase assembly protein subunit 23